MVGAINERVASVGAGVRQGKAVLRVVPIVGTSYEDPAYRLLEGDALEKVRVTEVNQSGTVPVLKVHNELNARVFLMDGQELLGAKQNRILNTDVLVPGTATIDIPVSCVEAGRWRVNSPQFSPGKAASYSVRRGKSGRVHQSLKREAKHDGGQHEVWDEVACCIEAAETRSDTSALHDAYAARRKELDEFRTNLSLPHDAVGVAVFAGERLRGIDVFDRHSTLKYFWESLVDSYAIELLSEPYDPTAEDRGDEQAVVRSTLEQAATGAWEGFDSPGEGRDYRLEHDRYFSSALVWEERVLIHLQVFPKQAGEQPSRRFTPRIRRHY